MRPLHDMNPARLGYVRDRCALRDKKVIDIGCGAGILSEALAAEGAKTVGLDVSEQVLISAKLHLFETGLEVDYRLATAEEAAAEDPGAFDVVTCMEMLEHVPDPVSVVRACADLLRPGGHCFFSTLSRSPAAFLLGIVGAEHIARLCPKGTHRYDRFIRPSELSQWIREAGLNVVDITGIHYNPWSRTVRLGGHVQVNYMVHARKR